MVKSGAIQPISSLVSMDVFGKALVQEFLSINSLLQNIRLQVQTTCILFLSLFCAQAWATPTSFNYQGRIIKTDGSPLSHNNVSFIFKVLDTTGTCVIYQEQVNGYDMTSSSGVFDVPIGLGTIVYPADGSLEILDVFNNTNTFACVGGTSTYQPSSGDGRKLRVMFHDGVGWQTVTPDLAIRSVPYSAFAHAAEKLGVYSASDFVIKTGIPICSSETFLTYDGNAFTCSAVAGATGGTVTSVSSANSYLSVANSTANSVLTVNVGTTAGTLAAGNDARISNAIQSGAVASGDLSGTYPAPSVAKIQGIEVSAATPTVSGQALRFDGARWVASVLGINDISGLAASLSTQITSLSGDVSTSGSGSAVATVNNVGGVTAASVASGADLANNATSVNTPNTIVKRDGSGGFSAGPVKVSAAVFRDSGSNTITVSAPAAVATSYSLSLPPGQGAINQLLINDGSGNLSWTNLSSMGVTWVSVTSPILNTGTASIPNIGIQQANGSQSGYLSSADWTTFNSKTTGTLNSANVFVGNASNVATGVALTGDVSLLNTGETTVIGLRGKTISATAPTSAGQVLRYDGASSYVPNFLSLADIRSTVTPTATIFPASSCTASQTLTWSSLSDTLLCTNIALSDSAVNFGSKAANTFFAAPNGSAGAPSFRALVAADLPVVPVSKGGTNSAAALNNNRIMASSGGAIVEASAITVNRALISDASGIPTHSTVTNTELGYLSGVTSAVQTQLDAKATTSGWANYSVMATNGTGALNDVTGTVVGTILQHSLTGPVFSTATYPGTTAVNQLLYSSAANTVTGLATANSAVLITNGSGVPSWSAIANDNFAQYALLAGRSGGQVLNGGTVASNRLTLDSTSNATKGYVLINPTGGNVGIGNSAPSEVLDVTGNVRATSFISTSDRRLKKNIETVEGLEKVLKLRGVRFQWRANDVTELGTIAQEVEEVFPELVITNEKTGYKAVKYQGLIAPLIEATKAINNKCEMSAAQLDELKSMVARHDEEVKQLKRRIASVESENADLKETLKRLEDRVKVIENKEKK